MKAYVKVVKDTRTEWIQGASCDYQKALLAFEKAGFEVVPYFSYFDICQKIKNEDILIDDLKFRKRVLRSFGVTNPQIEKHPTCLNAFIVEDFESIDWVSKWRCFICYDEVLALSFLKGDWHSVYDAKTVDTILASFKAWDKRPMACAMDFAITKEGKTVLIECKDALEIESDGLSGFQYARFLCARWFQYLCRQDPLCPEKSFQLKSYGYKYFISNQERIARGGSTDYLEFYPGIQKDEMEFWNDESLLINEDDFDEIGLGPFFDHNLKDFDFYDITYVPFKDWEIFFAKAKNESEIVQEAMKELADWVNKVLKEQPGFTILGL